MNSPGYISSPPQVEYIVGGVPGEFPWIYIISSSGRMFVTVDAISSDPPFIEWQILFTMVLPLSA